MTRFQIRKKLLAVGAGTVFFTLGTLGMGQAQAAIVTFDDLDSANVGEIQNGYQGFNWNNFYYLNATNLGIQPSGYENGIVSTPNVALNAFAQPASVSVSNGQFDFNSAYLTGAWNNGLNILVEGFLDGITKYSKSITVNSASPTKFSFDFFGIDDLKFSSSGGVPAGYRGGGEHFALDNFDYNAEPVPEPLTILGTVTAAGFGVVMRRKQKQQQKATAEVS
jgi:hypothetical protein